MTTKRSNLRIFEKLIREIQLPQPQKSLVKSYKALLLFQKYAFFAKKSKLYGFTSCEPLNHLILSELIVKQRTFQFNIKC